VYKVVVQPKGLEYFCEAGETLLDAAQKAGIKMPVSCKNGVCYICQGELLSGCIVDKRGREQGTVEGGASDAQTRSFYVCHAMPKQDCEIYLENVYGPSELPMRNAKCQVQQVTEMRAHVYKVVLSQPAGRAVEFFAGQYLAIEMPGRESDAFFSIASAPGSRDIELHIQADPHLTSACEMIDYLRESSTISVKLPFGKSCLSQVPDKAVMLLAAGTGFAQMKSLIEYLFMNHFEHEVALYWTLRKQSDLYAVELLDKWSQQYPNFHYKAMVAEPSDQLNTEHHSQLAQAVIDEHDSVVDKLVFASGSPKLVFSTMDALAEAGLDANNFYSDVLEYATRD
jgi:CDP-4-dehydro-6-deoxyglucose reductase, E3